MNDFNTLTNKQKANVLKEMLKGNIKLEVSKIEDLKSGTPVSITYQTVKR